MEGSIKKVCYACGLKLDDYPYDPEYFTSNHSVICPCCGIHYGCDDEGAGEVIPDELACSDWSFGDEIHKQILSVWRRRWISGGMKWEHDDKISLRLKPERWDPIQQLRNLPNEFLDNHTKQMVRKQN